MKYFAYVSMCACMLIYIYVCVYMLLNFLYLLGKMDVISYLSLFTLTDI